MIKGVLSVHLRRAVWSLLAWAVLSASGGFAAQAQQFSADIMMRRDDVLTRAGRLSMLDGRVRIETVEHTDGFFLVDAVKPSAYFVRPGARIYMDARQSSRLTRMFVPLDPDGPCRQWQAMARLSGVLDEWRCERIGEESIDGHTIVAFRVLSTRGEGLVGWIDRERRLPLRIKTSDGTLISLEQIRDEPQPASSFELPASYRKFSPEALIDRIKQSDVWVSTPDDAEPSRP